MKTNLINERQRRFFTALSKRRLPVNTKTLFSEDLMTDSLDFANALLKLYREGNQEQRSWILTTVMPQLHSRIISIPAEELREYIGFVHEFVWNQVYDDATYKKLSQNGTLSKDELLERVVHASAITFPFRVDQDDFPTATKLWNAVIHAGLTPDALTQGNITKTSHVLELVKAFMFAWDTNLWPCLVEAVKQDKRGAKEIANKLFTFLSVFSVVPKFVSKESSKMAWVNDRNNWEMLDLAFIPSDLWDFKPSLVPVPTTAVFSMNRTLDRCLKKYEQRHTQMVELVSWFGSYLADFEKTAEWMWREIQTDAKYGLRPGGRDTVKITVAALQANGYKCVQLFPKEQFPETDARFWVQIREIGNRISFDRLVASPELSSVAEESLDNSVSLPGEKRKSSYNDLVDRLQKFIAIHSLWKIVTGKITQIKPARTERSERNREELKRAFLVRPHFRWLPPGHNPSGKAQDRSIAQFGYAPPQGKTFVMSDPEKDTVYASIELSDSPVLTYTDQDLGYE